MGPCMDNQCSRHTCCWIYDRTEESHQFAAFKTNWCWLIREREGGPHKWHYHNPPCCIWMHAPGQKQLHSAWDFPFWIIVFICLCLCLLSVSLSLSVLALGWLLNGHGCERRFINNWIHYITTLSMSKRRIARSDAYCRDVVREGSVLVQYYTWVSHRSGEEGWSCRRLLCRPLSSCTVGCAGA